MIFSALPCIKTILKLSPLNVQNSQHLFWVEAILRKPSSGEKSRGNKTEMYKTNEMAEFI